MSQGRKPPEEGDNNAWMSTFSDLLMLMLTFFVLLLTMSSMDAKKIDKVVRPGLQTEQGPSQQPTLAETPAIPRIMPRQLVDTHQQLALAPIGEVVTEFADLSEEILSAHELKGRGWISRRPDGVDVNLDGAIMFEPGEETLSQASVKLLEEFAQMARVPGVVVRIETHVSGGDDADLWASERARALALARADVVAQFFMQRKIRSDALRIMGHGVAAGASQGRFLRHAELLSLKIQLPARR